MAYILKHSKSEQLIIEQCYTSRRPLPDFIKDAPELCMGLDLYFNAFLALDSCRSHGFSPGGIPWTAIKEYCEAFELDEDQCIAMFHHIPKMDQEYLQYAMSKAQKKKPPPPVK